MCVVQAVNDAFCWLSKRCGVRAGYTDECALSVIHSVRSVANTVVIGIGVERVGARVSAAVVDARVRLVHVVKAVTVVVLILHEWGDAGGVAVDGVGLTVAIRVGVSGRVKRERVRSGRAHTAHSVGAVAHAVAIRVGVGWTGARIRFVGIGHAVGIVVEVLGEPGGIGIGWIIIARQFVGQTVAIAVFKDFNREVPRQRIAVGVVRPHGVGRVGDGFSWCTCDFTGRSVKRQGCWQVG